MTRAFLDVAEAVPSARARLIAAGREYERRHRAAAEAEKSGRVHGRGPISHAAYIVATMCAPSGVSVAGLKAFGRSRSDSDFREMRRAIVLRLAAETSLSHLGIARLIGMSKSGVKDIIKPRVPRPPA